jgi:hypothetical protein
VGKIGTEVISDVSNAKQKLKFLIYKMKCVAAFEDS